jgi:hypothetical protein
MKKLTLSILFGVLVYTNTNAQFKAIIKEETPFYYSDEAGTGYAGYYQKGDTVQIQSFTLLKAVVLNKENRKTFISQSAFVETEALQKFRNEYDANQKKAYDAAKDDLYNRKLAAFTKLYGVATARKMAYGLISIGMTDGMVELTLGRPEKINATENQYGTSEQWVYPTQYLYFDNKKLTTIQKRK